MDSLQQADDRVKTALNLAADTKQRAVNAWASARVALTEVTRTRQDIDLQLKELARYDAGVGRRHFATMLEKILSAAIAVTRAAQGNIQVLNRRSGDLHILAQAGFEKPFLEYFRAVGHQGSACAVSAELGQQVVILDVTRSPVFSANALEILLDSTVRSVLSSPILNQRGKIEGVISVHYPKPKTPDERDLRALRHLALFAGRSINAASIEPSDIPDQLNVPRQ
jgi:GAF domain-containing protein